MAIDPTVASTVLETATETLKTQNGESIRAGVWVTALGVCGALLTLLTVVVTNWRGWKETASAGRTADFRRLREEIERRDTDMDEMKAELKAMRDQVGEATRKTAEMNLKMVKLQTGFSLVSAELARHDPDNPVLKQARDLIAGAATSDEDIFMAGINSLSKRTS